MDFDKFNYENSKCMFKAGSRIKLDAREVCKELNSIMVQNNKNQLLPKDVVDYARKNPESELYKGFEWNDTKAAEEYRLIQARQIIYNIRVIPLEDEQKDIKSYNIEFMPFTHLPNDEGYRSTIEVYKNEETYEQLKQKAYKDLIYWRDKYSNIIEFKSIVDDINNLQI